MVLCTSLPILAFVILLLLGEKACSHIDLDHGMIAELKSMLKTTLNRSKQWDPRLLLDCRGEKISIRCRSSSLEILPRCRPESFPIEDERSQQRTDEDTDDDVSIVIHCKQHDEVGHSELQHMQQSSDRLL
jgi:hypothetical protein